MELNFNLPEEKQNLFDLVKQFGEKEIKPMVGTWDEEERFPIELYDKMAAIGLLGILTPEEYGGQGGDYMDYTLVCEAAAYYDPSVAVFLGGQNCVSSDIIGTYGTEEQKRKYLPPLAKGIDHAIGAYAMTEPEAGSDVHAMRSRAVLKGDHYVLNGSKQFISQGTTATVYLVFANTENGPSCFIVERNSPGLSVAKKEHKCGVRASDTGAINFDDVIVPKENLVGKEGEGLHIGLSIMSADRAGIAAMAVGMAQRAIDEAVKYTTQRVQFGKRISQFQNTQFVLAELQTKTDAARLMAYRAAMAVVNKEPSNHLASMAKYFASDIVNDVARRALQFLGGYGYCRDYPMEKILRDAKIFEIFTGTNEMQKIIISRWMGVK